MEVEAESYKDDLTVLRMSLTNADEKIQLVNLLTSFSQQQGTKLHIFTNFL